MALFNCISHRLLVQFNKWQQKQLFYPLDSHLSAGRDCPTFQYKRVGKVEADVLAGSKIHTGSLRAVLYCWTSLQNNKKHKKELVNVVNEEIAAV